MATTYNPLEERLMLAKQLENVQPGALMAAAQMQEQAKAEARNEANRAAVEKAGQFRYGVLENGVLKNPATGDTLEDINGNRMISQDQMINTADAARAQQGIKPGEKTQDQVKAEMMTSLAASISGLPEEDRHLAFERGIGVLMGKGVVQFRDVPPWDKGGREMASQLADLHKSMQQPDMQQQQQAPQGQGEYDLGKLQAQGRTPVQEYKQNGIQAASLTGQPQPTHSYSDPMAQDAPVPAAATPTAATPTAAPARQAPQPKPLSAESAKVAGLAQAGLDGIAELEALLRSGGGARTLAAGKYLPAAFQNQGAQDYSRLAGRVSETLGRLNSGGAINRDEEKRFLDALPQWGDTAATKKAKLDGLRTQIGTVQESMGLAPAAAASRPNTSPILRTLDPAQLEAIMRMRKQITNA